MTESRGTGRVWATALILVAIATLVAGVYVIDRLIGLPGRAVATGREIAAELRDLASAFHAGSVETAFVSYASQLSASNKLQVAELRQVEVFTRTESSTVLWGALQLPDVVVEARVPVDYVYTLDLDDTWRFELEDRRLTVMAPRLEFNPPALDVSHLEYDIRASSILRDENAAVRALQAGLTELSRQRAGELTQMVRETARRQAEEFIGTWLGAVFDHGADYSIDVIFEGEPMPGEGAALDRRIEGSR